MRARSKSSNVSGEIAHIEELIADLEKRLHRLNGSAERAANGSTSEIGDFVNNALESIMERMRDTADAVTDDVGLRASKAGTAVFQRVVDEVEHYPLATLAVAAGIGFLLGSTRR